MPFIPYLILNATAVFPAACRVWDIRTKVQVHCLSGHEDTVAAILAMPTDPQARRYAVLSISLLATLVSLIPGSLCWLIGLSCIVHSQCCV